MASLLLFGVICFCLWAVFVKGNQHQGNLLHIASKSITGDDKNSNEDNKSE